MNIWYKNRGETQPTFFSEEPSGINRPDENSFKSNVPQDFRVGLYTILWDGDTPSLVRKSNADETIREDAVTDALARLKNCYKSQITNAGFETVTTSISMSAAVNRKDGTPKPKDEKILSDIDIVDDWNDDLESDMEVGESWIEDPARTTEELKTFDPCTDLTWTPSPIL